MGRGECGGGGLLFVPVMARICSGMYYRGPRRAWANSSISPDDTDAACLVSNTLIWPADGGRARWPTGRCRRADFCQGPLMIQLAAGGL